MDDYIRITLDVPLPASGGPMDEKVVDDLARVARKIIEKEIRKNSVRYRKRTYFIENNTVH